MTVLILLIFLILTNFFLLSIVIAKSLTQKYTFDIFVGEPYYYLICTIENHKTSHFYKLFKWKKLK